MISQYSDPRDIDREFWQDYPKAVYWINKKMSTRQEKFKILDDAWEVENFRRDFAMSDTYYYTSPQTGNRWLMFVTAKRGTDGEMHFYTRCVLHYLTEAYMTIMIAMTIVETNSEDETRNETASCNVYTAHMFQRMADPDRLGVDMSDRIKTIRTIMDELQRIDGHLLFLGCYAQDLGALTAFLYCMRDREYVLNAMEETTGGRLIQNYYRIGGLQADIDENFQENVKKLCAYLKPKLDEYMNVFGENVITHQRLEGVGVFTKEQCIDYGVSGSNGRASNWANDLRKNYPYDMYDKVEWDQVVLENGDAQERYYMRIKEIEQSIKIIEQLIDNIPEGEYYIKQKPIIKCPEGQWYYAVEGTSGEFGVYLDSRGDKSPFRMKLRPMALSLVGALDEMLRGTKVADLIAVGAGLDYIIPDIDR